VANSLSLRAGGCSEQGLRSSNKPNSCNGYEPYTVIITITIIIPSTNEINYQK